MNPRMENITLLSSERRSTMTLPGLSGGGRQETTGRMLVLFAG